LAHASWLAPVIAAALAAIILFSQGGQPAPNKVQAIVGPALILLGLGAGIIALFGVARAGRRGILIPALIGTALNLGLVSAALLPMLFRPKPTPLQPLARVNTQRVLTDTNLGVSLEIPPDFVGFPQAREMHKADYMFVKGDTTDEELDLLLSVTALPGALPRRRASQTNNFPAMTNAMPRTFNWRGLEVDGFVVNEDLMGTPFTTFNIHLPVVPRAVQISIAGPTARQAELEKIATAVLPGIDARSNW
jgi:hypothetical protein